MMNKLIFICFLLLASTSFGQSKKVWLENADEYFEKGDYSSALKYYQLTLNDSLALSTDVLPYEVVISNQKLKNKNKSSDSTAVPASDYINHQIAVCLQQTKDYSHAVDQFKLSSKSPYYSDDVYFLGDALMKVKNYEEALSTFDAYTRSDNKTDSLDARAVQQMIACNYALDEGNFKKEVIVEIADTAVFNKGTSAFATMYFGFESRVLFTSAREGGIILDPEKQDSKYLCDLYWTEKINDTTWSPAHNFGRPLNSALQDASGSFNNNNVIFYNRWNDETPKDQSMYLARMVDFKFFESYKLGDVINFPNSRNINPFVAKDNETLFFSSDRPGGKGGLDIWKVKIDPSGNVIGEPENLGYPVNTEFDEVTPFFHKETSTLFFSSTGHNSIGGLDVFKSRYDVDNYAYEIPKNLGLPINSCKDDAYLIWDSELKSGFFSSDREPCETGHCYDIYTVVNEPIHINLEGYVYDKVTEEIIPNAQITFKDVRSKFADFVLKSDENGFYSLELQQQWELFIKAQKKDYFADATNIDTRSITETTLLTHDFHLDPIPVGEIQIDGIEYDFNSSTLRPESKLVLDKLFDFIQLNDNMTIQINSHTDARGSDVYNLALSQRRAQSCVDYLVGKGVAIERLIPIGYGETMPNYLIDENKKHALDKDGKEIVLTEDYINSIPSKDQQEEYHQRNRRTAFKVISQ
ncbi:MAG: OmpA family protein [Crocinitomicaceae bacterium]